VSLTLMSYIYIYIYIYIFSLLREFCCSFERRICARCATCSATLSTRDSDSFSVDAPRRSIVSIRARRKCDVTCGRRPYPITGEREGGECVKLASSRTDEAAIRKFGTRRFTFNCDRVRSDPLISLPSPFSFARVRIYPHLPRL